MMSTKAISLKNLSQTPMAYSPSHITEVNQKLKGNTMVWGGTYKDSDVIYWGPWHTKW